IFTFSSGVNLFLVPIDPSLGFSLHLISYPLNRQVQRGQDKRNSGKAKVAKQKFVVFVWFVVILLIYALVQSA
ncbi:MAG: hypothetical protein LBG14_07805, partial [Treponema sp.]|nr:hypothetical protein [Treponema sp.]